MPQREIRKLPVPSGPRGADPIDGHVGARIKSRRNVLGFTQKYLSQRLGVSPQQLQKYEAGINRLDATNLLETSRILRVPVDFFYDDTDVSNVGARGDSDEINCLAAESDYLSSKDIIELVTSYYAIENAKIRYHLFDLVKSLWQNDCPDRPAPRKRKHLQKAASLLKQHNVSK